MVNRPITLQVDFKVSFDELLRYIELALSYCSVWLDQLAPNLNAKANVNTPSKYWQMKETDTKNVSARLCDKTSSDSGAKRTSLQISCALTRQLNFAGSH